MDIEELDPEIKKRILDYFAQKQYNPESGKQDFQTWSQLEKSYREHGNSIEGWSVYCKDIEKVVSLAIHETRATDIRILEKLKDGYSPNAEARDYINVAIETLRETKEVRFYEQ